MSEDAKTLEQIIDRAKKLRDRADSAKAVGLEGEADTALKMMSALLSKYRISMQDLNTSTTEEKEEPIGRHRFKWADHGHKESHKRQLWVEDLALVIAQAHGCSILVFSGSNRITIIGRPSITKIVEYVIGTIVRAADTVANNEYNRFYNVCLKEGRPDKAKGYRNSFLRGFINRIAARLREADPTAMVLYNKDRDAVKKFFVDQKISDMVDLSRESTHNYQAYTRGTEVANSMSLKANAFENDELPTAKKLR